MFAIAEISSWVVRTFVCISILKWLLTLSNFVIMTSNVDHLTYGNKLVIISMVVMVVVTSNIVIQSTTWKKS